MARQRRRSAREKQAELEREAATAKRSSSANPYVVDVIRAARASATFEPIVDAEGLARTLNARRSEGYRPERMLILRNSDILVVFIRIGG